MTLPNIPHDRLEQMIHLACCCKQECAAKTWYQVWYRKLVHQLQSHPMGYGLGATALSASCIALFLAGTTTNTVHHTKTVADVSFSDYMMQDLLESLS